MHQTGRGARVRRVPTRRRAFATVTASRHTARMSLKRHLEDPRTELRKWLDGRAVPLVAVRRELVAALRAQTPLLPEHPAPPWSLLGNAIGLGVTWHHSTDVPPAAAAGGSYIGGTERDPTTGELNRRPDWFDDLVAAWQAGPSGDPRRDGAVATIAGVLERLSRIFYLRGQDPFHDLVRDAGSFSAAVDGIPGWICADVAACSKRGADALEVNSAPLVIGPAFVGSGLVGGADADVVVADVLWDVKANRDAKLRQRDLHQILCYALLDLDDTHRLTRAGFCCARFGVAVSWDLNWLAGGDLAEARAGLAEALSDSAARTPGSPPLR